MGANNVTRKVHMSFVAPVKRTLVVPDVGVALEARTQCIVGAHKGQTFDLQPKWWSSFSVTIHTHIGILLTMPKRLFDQR